MRCLFHNEQTASLVQKKNGWYCYGACQKLYTNEEVEARTGQKYEYQEEEEETPDISEEVAKIRALPIRDIRGLRLHADERGYYVLWSDGTYYKYRPFNPGNLKYIGAKGRRPPLFWARKSI